MKTVYIETSIPSYLTAKPSRDVRATAWQQITSQWWEQEKPKYKLYTSIMPQQNRLSDQYALLPVSPVLKFVHRLNYSQRRPKMYKDEIIAEIWRNRDADARKHNFDLDAIIADLRKREKSHPERLVDRSGYRTKTCTISAKSPKS